MLKAQQWLVSGNLKGSETFLCSDFLQQWSAALVQIKKISPGGVNQEWGRRLLIYKKHNDSKGLAIWSHLMQKKTVQHTSAGSKSISVLVQRVATELTTGGGQQAHNCSQFSHLLAVWSLANSLISSSLRFCFYDLKHVCLPWSIVLSLGIKL